MLQLISIVMVHLVTEQLFCYKHAMPRPKSHSRDELVEKAMFHFWHYGYEGTSMDDLVHTTNVSRHGLYGEFGGKHELFAACLDAYIISIVSPAFARVEMPDATLQSIASFYDYQFKRGKNSGWPPSGCLMANTMTELAPHDEVAADKVWQHNKRLHAGFLNVLRNSRPTGAQNLSPQNLESLAAMLVTFTNGLWSMSRATPDPKLLRSVVSEFLTLIERRLKS
jgi:TetR/AcrR family transcriptional regulator, transcriptional repressor for nem operon